MRLTVLSSDQFTDKQTRKPQTTHSFPKVQDAVQPSRKTASGLSPWCVPAQYELRGSNY